MNLAMRMLWHRELRDRLGFERYRAFVRKNGGTPQSLEMGDGPWNKNYCADPFFFFHDGTAWLFYETLDASGKGVLGCFREDPSSGEWVQQGIVLDEPWHLSYPQVFKDGDRIYMIPESCDAKRKFREGGVRLYEAVEFPMRWRQVALLIDRPFADSTLLRTGGMFYLACFRDVPSPGAELWQATSLAGPWTQHPQSGNLNQSKRLRRCGGAFANDEDGNLLRIAQDCNGEYGRRLFAMKVEEICPQRYSESWFARWPRGDAWHAASLGCLVHTYNSMRTPDALYETIDAKDYPPKPLPSRIIAMLRIVMHTLFRMKFKKDGWMVQILGVQFTHGKVKRRPAFVRITT